MPSKPDGSTGVTRAEARALHDQLADIGERLGLDAPAVDRVVVTALGALDREADVARQRRLAWRLRHGAPR